MTTKHCPKCLVSREYIEQVDAGPVTAGEVTTCGNEFCPCHTSPVSKVIAEAVKEFEWSDAWRFVNGKMRAKLGDVAVDDVLEELTTTLNRVVSVAREDEAEKAQVFGDTRYSEGRDAMKEKILAAISKWFLTVRTNNDNEFFTEIRTIITDLK